MFAEQAAELSRPIEKLDGRLHEFAKLYGYKLRKNVQDQPNREFFLEGNPQYYFGFWYHRISRDLISGQPIYQDDPEVNVWVSGYLVIESNPTYFARRCLRERVLLSHLTKEIDSVLDEMRNAVIEIGGLLKSNGIDGEHWKVIQRKGRILPRE